MSEEIDNWMQNAWLFQQERYKQLGCRKWDQLVDDEGNGGLEVFLDKLSHAFEICYGENYGRNKITKKVTDRVIEEAKKLFNEKKYNQNFACTFVNIKLKDDDKVGSRFCVIWLQKADGSERCLDFSGRNYESWDDFLDNNTLPKCHIIYPKSGRYYYGGKELFVDVIYGESVACQAKRIVKDVFDVASVIGGAAAAGVLVCNPVGASVLLGATAVSVVTGAYTVGNSVNRLVDIHNHDGGLSLTESKTLLAVGELAISAVGTAAVGASAGIRGIAAKTGTVLSEGSIAYKLASNVGNISRVFSGVNAGFHVVVVVDKYITQGYLGKNDILQLSRVLLFSFNVIVTEVLLEELVSFLAVNYSIEKIIQYCMGSPYRNYELVNTICRYTTSYDLQGLINRIFPNFHKYASKISNIGPLVKRVAIIADHTVKTIKSKKFNIEYIYFMQKQLSCLMNDVDNYKKKNEIELQKRFDDGTCEKIYKWTHLDGVDLLENNSRYESKINTPVEIMKKISDTVVMCSKYDESPDVLEERQKFLLQTFLKFVNFNNVNSSVHVINKINFYCNKFLALHNELMLLYHYEYFLYTLDHGHIRMKKTFFSIRYGIDNIYDEVYNQSLSILLQNLKKFDEEFEDKFPANSPIQENLTKEKTVFKFKMPFLAAGLKKKDFYDKAKEFVPKLETKLNDNSTTFDDYGDLAIINSNQDDFILFFYIAVDKGCLNGILLLVEDIFY